ncbi:MAG: adenosylcobinamide-GDP ribazoletransferase, partial [Betaproteobacteria bacterium]|nr:adenosylcobinamide-GDP ribazoletransferase [Betaproteobacteria bacterium]
AMVLVLLGKFLALIELKEVWLPAALVAGHAISRFCATLLLRTLDYVRPDDSPSKARPVAARIGNGELALAGAFALAGLLLLPPGPALRGCLLAGAVTLWLGRLLQRRLGGYTGDCLGATQQGAELAFYLGLLWTFS